MDFDTLIFILVFLAIVISNIKKILKQGKPGNTGKEGKEEDKKKKPDPLKALIGKVAARIQEEIAPVSKAPQAVGVSGWDAILGESRPVPEREKMVHEEERHTPPEPDDAHINIPEKHVFPLEQPIEAVETDRVRESRTSEPRLSTQSIKELRKAIVWSEILAPPVAMRDE